jgi:hypothetical protein
VIMVDLTWVEIVDLSTEPTDAGYVARSIDISALGDGRQHILQFEYTYDDSDGTGRDGDIYIDDITVDAAPATPFVTPAAMGRAQR